MKEVLRSFNQPGMKRLDRVVSINLVMCVFILIFKFISIQEVHCQITVSLNLPAPGSFRPEDFIKLVSFQNSGNVEQVYMAASVEEHSAGIIFSGRSAVFTLSEGYSAPHYSVFEPVEVQTLNPVYEKYILRTNTLPPGKYVVCVELFRVTQEKIALTCIPLSVIQPSAPVLVYPASGGNVVEAVPVFTWLPPAPLPSFEFVYSLRMVEVLEGQDPNAAMATGMALYTQTGINGITHQYDNHAQEMLAGHTYAWQVQALTADGIPVGENDGLSEVTTFTYNGQIQRMITIVQPVAACVGNVTQEITAQAVDIQWLANGRFTAFNAIVYENPCGRYPPVKGPKYPAPPQKTPPSQPATPSGPKTPDKPTSPSDSIKDTPADSLTNKPVNGPVTTPVGSGDTTSSGVTVIPRDSIKPGINDWPEEEEGTRPPLPPGWAWGEEGPYWTGEHPPPPPDLPPGWEWGPLRPHWVGEGATPPERSILYVSPVITAMSEPISAAEPVLYHVTIPLDQVLKPGEAFIVQVYGTFEDEPGHPDGYLSASQCIRYSAITDNSDSATPLPCNICNVRLETRVRPRMDGGLSPPNDSLHLFRDDFLTLLATGEDWDEIWWFCNPGPDCPETPSADMRITSSRVKFTWEIVEGEGVFVELGCSGVKKATEGNRVIFMPPYVKPDTLMTTRVKLSIIDDNKSQPEDSTIERMINIRTERTRKHPDQYKIIIKSDSFRLPSATQTTGLAHGTCMTQGPKWTKDKDLVTPVIKLPDVKEPDKIVFGELIRLYADDIRDPDNILVWCRSIKCDTNTLNKDFEDNIEFEWNIRKGGGKFIKGNKGRWIVYQAPEEEGDVEIEVKVYNPSYAKIRDVDPPKGKINLKVFQPGVRIEQTPLSWLPENGLTLEKKSRLVYREGKEWKEAFPHQCRIHFFELMEVSKEPGICLNWPPKNHGSAFFPDVCQDLSIKKTDKWELFDTVKCKRWNHTDTLWFNKANSKLPEREFTISISVFDYGAYGFVRSMANGNKSSVSPYKSIPWGKEDKKHPTRPDDTKPAAADNRVTIPMDADENHVADYGWQTIFQKFWSGYLASSTGLTRSLFEKDPQDPVMDTDSIPKSNYPGDGISAYEEYRGFFVKGSHQRFGMASKDLLIWDRNNVGLGYFRKTGIQCWMINENEFDRGRVIDLNRTTHTLGFDQKGIKLFKNESAFMNGTYGVALRSASADGLVTCDSVLINVKLNNDDHRDLSRCIAHELSHSVGVFHHGEGYITGYLLKGDHVGIGPNWVSYPHLDTAWFNVACKGGVTSGDVNCWMRYVDHIGACPESASLKSLDCRNNGWKVNLRNLDINRVNDNVIGTNITNINTGTGLNAGGNCGQNAGTGMGKCINQIRISCRRP